MMRVLRALALAAADALQPRMLAIVFLPALASLLAWGVAAWLYWDAWTGSFAQWLAASSLARWSAGWGDWLLSSASIALVLVLLVPAVIVTALAITELAAMPLILRYVRERHYPEIDVRGFGSVWGGLANLLAAVAVFAILWLMTLPLWFTGIGALIVPAVNSAYLNLRIFRYDVLAEHASAEEYAVLKRGARGPLFGLGLALAVLYYVPLVNLVAPVLSGLAYTHLGLAELRRLRARPVQRR